MAAPKVVQRLSGAVWAGAWLWPLISPIESVFKRQVHPAWLAGAAMLAFIALYLVVVVGGFEKPATRPGARLLVGLGVVTALALALVLAYAGRPGQWLSVLMYVSAAGASTLWIPVVFGWVLATVGAILAIGVAQHIDGGDLGSMAFSALMAGALVIVVKQMSGYINALRCAQAELARTAVAEERLRFARDLHDLLGHTLSLIVVKAEVVRRLVGRDTAQAEAAAADIEAIGRTALEEVREAVTGYRQRAFAAELDGARTALSDAGIEVAVEQVGTPLPEHADALFGWAVREAATNVIRHSGARRCTILVRRRAAEALLEIRDDGVGCPAPGTTGNGLRGLGERFTAAGGSLSASGGQSGGFVLRATVPVAP